MRPIPPARADTRNAERAAPSAVRGGRSPVAALALAALVAGGCDELEEPDEPFDPAALASAPFAPAPIDPFAAPPRPVPGVDDRLADAAGDAAGDAVGDRTGDDDGIDGAERPADDDPARPFAPVDVPGDYRNLAGLYDASIARPLGVDVRYVLITAGGTFTLYDYQLDPYGRGLNCYADGRPRPLVRERGDDYLLDGRSVRIARETLGIGFGYTDGTDDDRDGDPADFVYYRYPRVAGLSPLDFVPCR